MSAGVPGNGGVTYTLNVANNGLKGKGLNAEDLTISLVVPAGSTVVSTTGAGYQGVKQDAELKSQVAVWHLNKLSTKEKQTYSLTLSRAATAAQTSAGTSSGRSRGENRPTDQATSPRARHPQTN